MKRKISIIIIITLILNVAINLLGNISLGATKNGAEDEKKNPESYWSRTNAPVFYGTTKITLKKGIIEEFNVLDSRFRIFAKDFEDGEITPPIPDEEEEIPPETDDEDKEEEESPPTISDDEDKENEEIIPPIADEEDKEELPPIINEENK